MVLKADMLAVGMNYPEEVLKVLFLEYSDGIISGARVEVSKDMLIIHPGIFKFKGAFYYMLHEERISYSAHGEEYYLRIRVHEEQKRKEQIIRTSDIFLTTEEEEHVNDIELGRFKLKEGAQLRQDYKDFSDLNTEHNTLNVINVNYSAKGSSTISPLITGYFGKELLKCSSEPLDLCFAMECLRGEAMKRNLMQEFLNKRLEENPGKFNTNMELFRGLERVLKLAGSEGCRLQKIKRSKKIAFQFKIRT